jgi:hypothetical protein
MRHPRDLGSDRVSKAVFERHSDKDKNDKREPLDLVDEFKLH